MKKIIYTKNAPEPVGPYSQAILASNFLYCSGQIGINPKTNELVGDIEQQTKQVIKNIESVLIEAGFDSKDVIKTNCYLSDMADFSVFNEIYAQFFTHKPARSCVQAKLPKNALVEVEVVAYRE